ncbi:hypothetical protein BDV98DRAFT_406861 [Pterulicium gracile]|uniref:HAT C-terminal dimerisation domain-containing protein n=1 Tax=Pterulicium gracile TaxID=1884261 RepID=A0A5C3QLR6_9AGAR|nr:hypothetical protein BDV98DRAFT_406861 [Pterula gracilis]
MWCLYSTEELLIDTAIQTPKHSFLLATSTDVERLISRGRFLLPYVRNQLGSERTNALLCLGSWLKSGLLNQDALIDMLRA